MIALKAFSCIILGMLTISSETNAECNICANKLWACINSTSFNPCPNAQNALRNQVLHCPANTVCTEETGICKPNGSGVVLGCDKVGCNKCTGTTSVTCVTRTSYGFCGPNNAIIGVVKCEDGNVCDFSKINSTGICATACLGTPTCDNTEIEATTVAPPVTDLKSYCNGPDGYHATSKTGCSDSDRRYVYCETVDGVLEVVLFKCEPGTGYFDEATGRCGPRTGCA